MPKRRRSSPVTDFKLVPVDPKGERRRFWFKIEVLVIVLALGFVAGLFVGPTLLNQSSDAAEQKIAELQQKLADSQRQLTVYHTNKTITHAARNELKSGYQALQSQIDELQKAVAFYKNIMAPGARKQGLHIEKLSLQPSASDTLNYRLVLTQVGNNKWRPYLKGKVSWQLIGTKDGKPVTLGQQVFVNSADDSDFHFRYFQALTGEIDVPEGVTPKSVIVSATSTGNRKYHVKKTFNWNKLENH